MGQRKITLMNEISYYVLSWSSLTFSRTRTTDLSVWLCLYRILSNTQTKQYKLFSWYFFSKGYVVIKKRKVSLNKWRRLWYTCQVSRTLTSDLLTGLCRLTTSKRVNDNIKETEWQHQRSGEAKRNLIWPFLSDLLMSMESTAGQGSLVY